MVNIFHSFKVVVLMLKKVNLSLPSIKNPRLENNVLYNMTNCNLFDGSKESIYRELVD
jgi:hypothetical protein